MIIRKIVSSYLIGYEKSIERIADHIVNVTSASIYIEKDVIKAISTS